MPRPENPTPTLYLRRVLVCESRLKMSENMMAELDKLMKDSDEETGSERSQQDLRARAGAK